MGAAADEHETARALGGEEYDAWVLLSIKSGGALLSQGVYPQVPLALTGLTAVFGMGTGVSPSLRPPEIYCHMRRIR